MVTACIISSNAQQLTSWWVISLCPMKLLQEKNINWNKQRMKPRRMVRIIIQDEISRNFNVLWYKKNSQKPIGPWIIFLWLQISHGFQVITGLLPPLKVQVLALGVTKYCGQCRIIIWTRSAITSQNLSLHEWKFLESSEMLLRNEIIKKNCIHQLPFSEALSV